MTIDWSKMRTQEMRDNDEYERRLAMAYAQRAERYAKTDGLKYSLEYAAIKAGVPVDYTEWVEAVAKVKAEIPLPSRA